jgi:hypothetical protein
MGDVSLSTRTRMGDISRTCEEWNVYIGGKETSSGEVPEHGEAIDEDKDGSPDYPPDGQVWLEAIPIDQGLAVDTLSLHAIVCMWMSRGAPKRNQTAATHRRQDKSG